MKKILMLLACAAALLGLPACNSETPLNSDIPLYQDYVVENNNGTVTAFATFKKYNSSGEQVKLNNGASIKVNNQPMTYYDTHGIPGSYNYVLDLASDTKVVTFDFQRNSNTHLVTECDLALIPEFTVDNRLPELHNNTEYWINISDGEMYPLVNIQAVLVSENGISGYNAIANNGTKSYRFTGVPNGNYTLHTTLYITHNVTASDGNAKGIIKSARVVTTYNVTVN